MLISGMFGAIFLGAMEGVAVLFGKVMGGGQIDPQPIVIPEQHQQPAPAPQQQPQSSSSSSSSDSTNYPITSLFRGKGFGFGGSP